MQNGSGSQSVVTVIIVSLVVGVLGGLGGAWVFMQAQPAPEERAEVVERTVEERMRVITEREGIVEAVDLADPAVVKVVATAEVQPRTPFEHFFGPGEPRIQEGMGSGVIFEYDGRKLVLTNRHVLGDAQDITIETREGEEFAGTVLGADRTSDVAVLEIEGDTTDLPTATLGNSDDLMIGEWVVAIGHPFAFDHTVTVGVVSAQGPRALGPQMPTRTMIQTDAAINVGNSGGPLVNLAGEVIGINTMIFSPTGATVGIGFAIPINDAQQIVHFLMERGPWLGVETRPNSEGLARYLGLHTDRGVVVLGVAPDSPAEAAGIQQGDVILEIGDTEVTDGETLRSSIFAFDIGDTIPILIQRGPEQLEIEVTAGRIPEGYFQ